MADKFKPLFLTAEILTVPGKNFILWPKQYPEFLFSKRHVCHHEHIDTTMKCLT